MGAIQFDAISTKSLQVASEIYHYAAGSGSVGGTAGMGSNIDTGIVGCPPSQTAATWTIPLTHLKQGDVITGFMLSGQLESAGNAVTIDADLRFTTAATADLVDASVGTITQIQKTADYLIADSANFTAATVGSGQSYYVLITVTTTASTDVALQGIEVTSVRMS